MNCLRQPSDRTGSNSFCDGGRGGHTLGDLKVWWNFDRYPCVQALVDVDSSFEEELVAQP